MNVCVDLPCFMDVEASSLDPGSFPIEIAWSMPDGTVESHLINPHSIDHWTDWDWYAQHAIHRISRAQLHREGAHPLWVARRMNACLMDRTLYSDAVDFDLEWVRVLFRAVDLEPTFWIVGMENLWAEPQMREFMALEIRKAREQGGPWVITECYEDALAEAPRTHRAEADVLHLQAWYRRVIGRFDAFVLASLNGGDEG